MEVPKPYEFIGFGAMEVPKPYEFIGFGAMEVMLIAFLCLPTVSVWFSTILRVCVSVYSTAACCLALSFVILIAADIFSARRSASF